MDTGWVQCEIAPGYTGVKECSCVKARKAERLMQKSGLADVLKQQTFDSFDTTEHYQKSLKDTSGEYLKSLFSMPPPSLSAA